MLLKFVDRETELKSLNTAYYSGEAEFIVIYGRRRIGKTALIKRFLKDKKGFYFLARRQDLELERIRFQERFAKSFDTYINAGNWEELFDVIRDKFGSERLVIVIDEFPYWVMKDKTILDVFQFVWDEILRDSSIVLVLLGSYVSVMEHEVLGYKSPLFGRRTRQIELKPLNVRYLGDFFPNYSIEEIIMTYGALDTIPHYLSLFDGGKDFWGNVRGTFLDTAHPLYQEAEFLLMSELREYNTYFNIVKAIIDGASKLGEIADRSRVSITNISKYLKVLERLKIIKKERPVTAPAKEKRYLYSVSDNYFLFWLTYVYPFQEEIEEDADNHLDYIRKDYPRYMGRVFEKFVIMGLRDILGKPFTSVGKWWYKGNEIDVVGINDKRSELFVGECKWKDNVDCRKIYDGLVERAGEIKWKKQHNKIYAVFAKSFSKKCPECNCIDLQMIRNKLFTK